MKNLKLSMKLFVSFTIVLVLAILVGVVGIIGMNSIMNQADDIYTENALALVALGSMRELFQDQRTMTRNYLINAGNNEKIEEYHNRMRDMEREMEGYFNDYNATMTNASAEYAYFTALDLYHGEFAALKERLVVLAREDFDAAYRELYSQRSAEMVDEIVSALDLSAEHNAEWAKESLDDTARTFRNMLIFEIVVLIFAVIVAVLLIFYITGLIAKPLGLMARALDLIGSKGSLSMPPDIERSAMECSAWKDEIGLCARSFGGMIERLTNVAQTLERLSEGDLTVDIDLLSEADTIGKSLKQMLGSLNEMFAEIQASTVQVSTGSKHVADGAQSLAQGSAEQAASIEELSSSIAEIAERTRANSATANETSRLSGTIKENAEKGSRQMNEMITAVGDINEASKSISKIIKTIDDIAFQTNILALNAAVEAARAGQHGKGFAVVAEEVRNLASKSAEAAKDTGNMIQNSMEKAELGSRIAGETAASLNEIVSGISDSSHLVEEIAKSSEDQSLAISQINTGIEQVAQVVQQNSATAEQSAAASQEMSGQSDILQQLIGQFKLKESDDAYRSLPPAQRRGSGYGKY